MKWLIKRLIPSNKSIAKKAANSIQSGVNATADDKKAVIAKYATLGKECAEISATLTAILTDGNVDDIERDTLAALIEPLIAKCREVVGI